MNACSVLLILGLAGIAVAVVAGTVGIIWARREAAKSLADFERRSAEARDRIERRFNEDSRAPKGRFKL